jgi:hypothetical protein
MGPLRTEGNVVAIKHDIRRQLNPQLFDHVRRRGGLSALTARLAGQQPDDDPYFQNGPDWAAIGAKYRFGEQQFIPLVIGAMHAVCELDILFLRRETNESLITKPKDEYGGDLDNRIKIFLDALRVPRASNEIPSNVRYEEWENSHKFFCLLEDDALITKLSIEADILPGTYKHAEQKDVHIIMTAKIRVTSVVHYNLMFATDR